MENEEYKVLNEVYKKSIVDNDFESVSNIDYKALDKIDRKDLIEEAMRLMAILDENDILKHLESNSH